MKKVLILLLLVTGLATGLAQAEIYKTISPNGEVIYTDIPSPRAEKLDLPGLSVYEPPAATTLSIPRFRRSHSVGSVSYDEFSIQEPKSGAVIRNNLGIVDVSVTLKPALKDKSKHRIQYILDKELYGPAMDKTTIRISNLVRGKHTLSANLVDEKNTVLASTGTVTFHIRRQSVNQTVDVIDDDLPPGEQKDINEKNLVNPNYRTFNPNIRTPNPNIRTPNPNILTNNPNVITPPPAQ
jgi:hypothetical protein